MAWRCSGKTNATLVDNLYQSGIISSKRVVSAMKSVDRAHFATSGNPYEDAPQYIGYSVTISAPHMHGYALENLQDFLKPGMKALDVGSGSGYLTACMASMVGSAGHVVGIEHIHELNEGAQAAVDSHYPDWSIRFVTGDGRKGFAEGAPYDCIHVGAAAPNKPSELLEQLKSPGRMFVPVGTGSQYIIEYNKDKDGSVSEHKLMGVVYVPLTGEHQQRRQS